MNKNIVKSGKEFAMQFALVLVVLSSLFWWGMKAYTSMPPGEVLAKDLQEQARDCLSGNRKACEDVGKMASSKE